MVDRPEFKRDQRDASLSDVNSRGKNPFETARSECGSSIQRPPRVSIGLPVYNGLPYLEAAVESLLGQTYGDLELIISDNGSTDGTADLCRAFAARDSRVRYVRHERNRGAVWNFNEVVRLARGELFKWAAHDDVCAPAFIERCAAALDAHPDAVLSFPRTALIDGRGEPLRGLGAEHADEGGVVHARPHERLESLLLERVWVREIFGVIRLAALRETRLLPRYVGGEKVIVGELALRGTLFQVPETLFFSRWHQQQASWIDSAARERTWRDPTAPRRALLPYHVHCLAGHLAAIRRAPLEWPERFGCLVALSRWVLQVRKWRRLLSGFWHGWGSGGGQPRGTPRPAGPGH